MASASDNSTPPVASEDEVGEKWDRCIADTLLKTGTGFGLGLVFSLLLFKRRPWPVALGTGYGLGYAMSNCQHDFRRVETVHLKPVKVIPPPSSPPSSEKEAGVDTSSSPPPTQSKVEDKTESTTQEKSS